MEPNLDQHSKASANGLLATAARRTASSTMPLRMVPRVKRDASASVSQKANFQIATRDIHSPLQFVADTVFITLLGVAAGVSYQMVAYGTPGQITNFAYAGTVVALIFAAVTRLVVGDRAASVTTSFDRIRDVAQSWTLSFAVLVFVLFAVKAGAVASRGAVLSFYLTGLVAVSVWRVFSPVVLAPLAKRAGYASHDCIVIGDSADPLVAKFSAELQANGHQPPNVLRFHALCTEVQWPRELRSLSSRVADAARRLGPGEIYVCAGSMPAERLAALGRTLSILPRSIFVIPDAQTASLVRCKPASVGRFVALETRREPLGPFQRTLKRLTDVALASLALIILVPLFAIIAAAIKLDSHGPVFFRQTRNGYRGRPFKIFKFRSMHVLEDGPVIHQATRDDARITRIGRFLRKSSFDELPQFVNILLGDMSLVGPRPHAQAHDELYARTIENYEVRQHVKPGLTGWAQVNGLRGETATMDAMYRRIEFDLWYAVNASALLDVEILVRTVIEVCRRRNAY